VITDRFVEVLQRTRVELGGAAATA
jgi:hypothetical protein